MTTDETKKKYIVCLEKTYDSETLEAEIKNGTFDGVKIVDSFGNADLGVHLLAEMDADKSEELEISHLVSKIEEDSQLKLYTHSCS